MSAVSAPDPRDWIWSPTGDIWNAVEGSVQDARTKTREQARAAFQMECGEPWVEIRVWKRYARALDRQDMWEWYVESTHEAWTAIRTRHPTIGSRTTTTKTCPRGSWCIRPTPTQYRCGFAASKATLLPASQVRS